VKELFLAFLAQHDDAAWLRAIDRLRPAIHPVDRDATRIWFHFYPLALQALMERRDAQVLARQMTLAGRWRLADQMDDAAWFLFGHRHWRAATREVLSYVAGPAPSSLDLASQIQELARRLATVENVQTGEVLGVAAVALRTLQHVGPQAFAATAAQPLPRHPTDSRTADEVVASRERTRRRSFLRFFAGPSNESEVTFDERTSTGKFRLLHSQHLTTAAAQDHRDYRSVDERCTEGPIPVHCRSCSCGTCWVGILSGADKLSPMEQRERAKLAECGVNDAAGQSPIRLACMTQAHGPVSIVIPPWNGLFGRVLSRVKSEAHSSR
jgi:ferredoxin